jgi:hypothetical protein
MHAAKVIHGASQRQLLPAWLCQRPLACISWQITNNHITTVVLSDMLTESP